MCPVMVVVMFLRGSFSARDMINIRVSRQGEPCVSNVQLLSNIDFRQANGWGGTLLPGERGIKRLGDV